MKKKLWKKWYESWKKGLANRRISEWLEADGRSYPCVRV